jgi:enoyl-CoA hydratase
VFCAGLDLVESYEYDHATMERFVDAFDEMFVRLFMWDRPVVAAVNGHALAGGCILAMTADFRVFASGNAWIGLNEVDLGIPFPAGAFEIARFALRPDWWTDCLVTGRRFSPEEALGAGIVHHVTGEGQVLHEAVARARLLAALPSEAVAPIKHALRAPALERIRATRKAARARFLECWFAPQARDRIGALRDALLKKKG